ncbi:hypothetical protein AGDE_12818 [Angomonas deanei]|uniref:Uncharacterized protein n=1 Tax=Angomonas deanei TaxID=59799 RepID=A0A7G2CHU6_9TRYP|nr:hypothetical protein AGDE_12818 [Angomonas deanei]CAD2218989.1 hypothetical protein, conserved [Angomonas deanei]|eukprot:EPY23430.1 hypothetical protein AGDE_12818 [Angomonas deanei]
MPENVLTRYEYGERFTKECVIQPSEALSASRKAPPLYRVSRDLPSAVGEECRELPCLAFTPLRSGKTMAPVTVKIATVLCVIVQALLVRQGIFVSVRSLQMCVEFGLDVEDFSLSDYWMKAIEYLRGVGKGCLFITGPFDTRCRTILEGVRNNGNLTEYISCIFVDSFNGLCGVCFPLLTVNADDVQRVIRNATQKLAPLCFEVGKEIRHEDPIDASLFGVTDFEILTCCCFVCFQKECKIYFGHSLAASLNSKTAPLLRDTFLSLLSVFNSACVNPSDGQFNIHMRVQLLIFVCQYAYDDMFKATLSSIPNFSGGSPPRETTTGTLLEGFLFGCKKKCISSDSRHLNVPPVVENKKCVVKGVIGRKRTRGRSVVPTPIFPDNALRRNCATNRRAVEEQETISLRADDNNQTSLFICTTEERAAKKMLLESRFPQR